MARWLRVERSDAGYGCHVWLGNRVRIGSRKSLTSMWPHITRGADEYCNDAVHVHVWPLFGLDVWWRWRQRTAENGPCARCRAELAAEGICWRCGSKPCWCAELAAEEADHAVS